MPQTRIQATNYRISTHFFTFLLSHYINHSIDFQIVLFERQTSPTAALGNTPVTYINYLLVIANLIFPVAIQSYYKRKELPNLLYNVNSFLFQLRHNDCFLRSASVVLFPYQFTFGVPSLIVRNRR